MGILGKDRLADPSIYDIYSPRITPRTRFLMWVGSLNHGYVPIAKVLCFIFGHRTEVDGECNHCGKGHLE